VTLAMMDSGSPHDEGAATGSAAGRAVAFRPVGIIVGLAARSHTLAILMRVYGGSRSIYMNFFSRSRNITFPRYTTMDIGIGSRIEAPMPTGPTLIELFPSTAHSYFTCPQCERCRQPPVTLCVAGLVS
jgi:hypothetical protein